MTLPLGPLVNALAICLGSVLGLLIGSRLPERIRQIVFQALGLCTCIIGIKMALPSNESIILIFSLLGGAIIGESLNLEDRFMGLSDKLKARLGSANPRFTEGFVNGSVLFCIGAMAIIGSFDEGLRGDHTVVFSKSILDGFASVALASAFGSGVILSALPVLIYQALLVLFAGFLQVWLTPAVMLELSATGGLMILGIGLNLLNLTKIKLFNFLPALILVVILTSFFGGKI